MLTTNILVYMQYRHVSKAHFTSLHFTKHTMLLYFHTMVYSVAPLLYIQLNFLSFADPYFKTCDRYAGAVFAGGL